MAIITSDISEPEKKVCHLTEFNDFTPQPPGDMG